MIPGDEDVYHNYIHVQLQYYVMVIIVLLRYAIAELYRFSSTLFIIIITILYTNCCIRIILVLCYVRFAHALLRLRLPLLLTLPTAVVVVSPSPTSQPPPVHKEKLTICIR